MEKSYPFEREKKTVSDAEMPVEQTTAEAIAQEKKIEDSAAERQGTAAVREERTVVKGKGRRDGNSAASRVIHSGKVSDRARAIKTRQEEKEKTGRVYPFEKETRSRREDDKEKAYPSRWRHGDEEGHFASHREHGGRDYGRKPADRKYGGKSERFDAKNDLRGQVLSLKVLENTETGSFLELKEGSRILLPFSEQTHKPQVGEELSVTIYEDKGGRLTATMRRPLVAVGDTGVLTVAALTRIGAFADNGMPKQVLIPYKEMLHTPAQGEQVLVSIYQDKSGRQAGTMRVYRQLKKESPYQEGDHVEGFVYEIKPELGAFVAVDDCYYGMIPARELFTELHYGDRVTARVSKVREDGKLDLLLREKLYLEVEKDAEKILQKIRENGGSLPYADKANADLIRREFSMSKNQFKRALGTLYKKRLIEIDREKDCVTTV